jgi:UDP-glucose 4-epimerase
MAHYLVTGGCGFIGSHLVDALLEQGNDVRILDNLSSGHRENASSRAELMIGDVADRVAVRDAVRDVDGVFHLAAVASVERSNDDWVGTHVTNLSGAITVFDAARNLRGDGPIPVVYASSAAIYGHNEHVPLVEEDMPQPMTAYGADKLGCELHARIASTIHGVPTVGLRFFNVYGSRQDPSSPYSGVISIFCERIMSGVPLSIYGDGEQVRDFIHVSDVVRLTMKAMSTPMVGGEVFNVCTGKGTTVRELVDIVAELCQVSPDIIYRDPRSGDVRMSVGNPARAFQKFGVQARTPFAEGLRDTLASTRERQALHRRYA